MASRHLNMVDREVEVADRQMEAIPSVIASASIVGAAVVGLAIGRKDNADRPTSSSENRAEVVISCHPPRPTTSAVDTPANTGYANSYPISNSDLQNSKNRDSLSRRNTIRSSLFFRRQNKPNSPAFEESTGSRKESVSSRRSFFERLSQASLNSSPRSSIAPDSPSSFHGSAAPFLNTTDSPTQLAPNKLVKRASPRQSTNVSPSSHKNPPSLHRRPATSHHRTATLQEQFKSDEAIRGQPVPWSPFSFLSPQTSPLQTHWKHYFVPRIHECSLDISPRELSKSDGSLQAFYTSIKRILPDRSIEPWLITTNMVKSKKKKTIMLEDNGHMHESDAKNKQLRGDRSLGELNVNSVSSQAKPQRSLSKHFSSPPPWKFRSGSIGKRQGQSMEKSDDDENVPPVVTTSSHISPQQRVTEQSTSKNQMIVGRDIGDLKLASNTLGRPAKRNTFTSLSPLPQVSSSSHDMGQIGSSSLSPKPSHINSSMHDGNMLPMQYPVPNQSSEIGSSPPVSATSQSGSHRALDVLPSDRASTLVGSDNETRGFYFGEDEETDFSETIFDSFRTGTTGSLRLQNPLESMFDTSPSGSLVQSKMSSLCESTLHGSFHEAANIAKEKESVPVTDQDVKSFSDDINFTMNHDLHVSAGHVFSSSLPVIPSVSEDFGRLSLEGDDDDEDWAREAEETDIRNSLSPPSSNLNSRHVSSNSRHAMFDLTNGNASSNRNHTPYNRLAQWSESQAEKKQYGDMLERPKTEHGMQDSDSNGLRRRTPSFLLRSHSVPVVPDDIMGRPKTAKVTEEWGDDFFEHSDDGPDIDNAINIPLSIQATQASILGHAQMIRDVTPIVFELKRLYNLAQQKKLLGGSHASLCDEAEGIIALTDNAEYSPIDKPSPSDSPTSNEFDPDDIADAFRDCGFDVNDGEPSGEVLANEPEVTTTRRQSVFLPGDDIFGHSTEMTFNLEEPKNSQSVETLPQQGGDEKLLKPSTFPRISKDPASVARLVMEQMHTQRSISDPLHSELLMKSPEKMPFDTTSLKDLVTRANSLVKTLNEIIQASECVPQSPVRTSPRPESPAFTRVFTDPLASPPKRLPRSKSNLSNISGSPQASPTRSHGKRVHVMKVL